MLWALSLGVPAPLRLETVPFYQGDARTAGAVPAALVSGTLPVRDSRHEAAAVPAKTVQEAWKALLKPNAQAPTDAAPSGASSLVAANAAADQVGKDAKEVNAADTGNAADTSKAADASKAADTSRAADTSILDSMRAQEMGAEVARAAGDKSEAMRIYAQHLNEDKAATAKVAEAAKPIAPVRAQEAVVAPKSAEDLALEAAVVAERKKAAVEAEQQIAAQIAAAAGVKQQVDTAFAAAEAKLQLEAAQDSEAKAEQSRQQEAQKVQAQYDQIEVRVRFGLGLGSG